ncbi:MAG: hypothetical protein ACT4OM_10695 [Actinomycetota bacterium]
MLDGVSGGVRVRDSRGAPAWLTGRGFRAIALVGPVDRKAVRRYIEAAMTLGLTQQSQPDQITDELVGQIVEMVRPARPNGKGTMWELIEANRNVVKAWLDDDLQVTKVQDLLERKTGVRIPYSTLHRSCGQEFGSGTRRSTVRVDDCEPGSELQVDFGRMGLIYDPETQRMRMAWALIFTPVYSRYSYAWLSFRQTLEAVIQGFEAAWQFYRGAFKVVVPDNLKAVVIEADSTNPTLNPAFLEYAQSRGSWWTRPGCAAPGSAARVTAR